jgi:hypothetical protein
MRIPVQRDRIKMAGISPTQQKMLEAIAFYRQVGFFQRYSSMSDGKIMYKLDELTQDDYFHHIWDELYGNNQARDLELLWRNKERVLWFDTEIVPDDVISLIDELANISEDIFQPTQVELIEAQNRNYKISFVVNSQSYSFDYLHSGAFNPDLIAKINAILKTAEYQFGIVELDQYVYIMFLSKQQKQKMMQERKINFL